MRAWVALNAAPGIGPHRFQQILKAFGSPEAALGCSALELGAKLPGLGTDGAAAVLAFTAKFDAARELEWAAEAGAKLLRLGDPDYPPTLLTLYDPPPLLYLRGALPGEGRRALAVVGTRKPTDYGLGQCRALIRGLAPYGVAIVSGLARGIDTAAHSAALDFGLPTLAVLGSGLGKIYPAENAGLSEKICAQSGGLLSQFSMGTGPDRHRFPMRNGVIAGISSGVLVVEGEEDSGSLITAEWALEQGREIFALPGRADSPQSRGPHRLIQRGAKLVAEAADILAEFPGASPRRPEAKSRAHPGTPELPGLPRPAEELTGEEALIAAALRAKGRMSVQALLETLGMEASRFNACLTMLEIKGALRRLPGALLEAL
jgi:DNA processing protein